KIYNLNKDISRTKLLYLVVKELNCSYSLIKGRYGNFNIILSELKINIPKNYISIEDKKKRGEKIREGQKNSKKLIGSMKKNISLNVIGDNLLNKFKYERLFSMNEFQNDNGHRNFTNTVIIRVLKENNTTLEELAKSKGVEFVDKRKTGGIGFNEKRILDDFEEKIGYKIIRSFRIGKYTTDGYIREIDKPVEVDEPYHFDKNGSLRVEDIIRENNIKDKISCGDFIRIKDENKLINGTNNKQKGLENFKI
ncbi:unnamed protein product, partial [marine sediment metagenome]